jgi:hypothetical protein
MTGKERLEQVRKTLKNWEAIRRNNAAQSGMLLDHEPIPAIAALDGCILLTAEEAGDIHSSLEHAWGADPFAALLTPDTPAKHGDSGLYDPMIGDGEPEADDIGPPPPGADGEYPDPEIGLEC